MYAYSTIVGVPWQVLLISKNTDSGEKRKKKKNKNTLYHPNTHLPLERGWQTKRSEKRTSKTIDSGEGVPRARTKYTPSVVTMAFSRSSLSRLTDSDNTNLTEKKSN